MMGAVAAQTRGLRTRRRAAVLAALAAAGVAGLVALGVWQIQRRAWKLDLIARVDARVHASPSPAPPPDEWPGLTRRDAEYRRVFIRGHYLQRITLVRATTELGPGFWQMAPLQADGFRVLINRGFVPDEPGAAAAPLPPGDTEVTGLLRMSEPGGAFLRANDPAHDRWYSRDTEAIARAAGDGPVAPYFIDAAAVPGRQWPRGGMTVISFPNNHLVYAVTWFALAAGLAVAATRALGPDLRLRG